MSNIFYWLFCIVLHLQILSAQEFDLYDQKSLFSNPEYQAPVAKVDSIKISAEEFLLNYEFGPGFTKRNPDSKNKHLKYLIYEKLLALEGYKQKVDSSAQIRSILKEIEGDLASEELFKKDIISDIRISEKDIVAGIINEQNYIKIQWIYANEQKEILRYKQILDSGASFDSLFKNQLIDSMIEKDRSLETTRYRLGLKNPEFSRIVDTLEYRKISNPINGPDGWYLVKIVNAWTIETLSETEMREARVKIERSLYKNRMDSLSDVYIFLRYYIKYLFKLRTNVSSPDILGLNRKWF